MIAQKMVIFNGKPKMTFGTVLRKATIQDKVVGQVPPDDDYLLVNFNNDEVEFRGLWKENECQVFTPDLIHEVLGNDDTDRCLICGEEIVKDEWVEDCKEGLYHVQCPE